MSGRISLVVRLTLDRNEEGKYVIVQQTDFYQPEDIANLIFARLTPLIYVGKRAGSVASNLNTWVFKNIFGWWRPVSTVGTRKSE